MDELDTLVNQIRAEYNKYQTLVRILAKLEPIKHFFTQGERHALNLALRNNSKLANKIVENKATLVKKQLKEMINHGNQSTD